MKRAGLWAIGIGVLCIVGILTVKQGYPDRGKCSNATLNGTYLFSGTSVLIANPSDNDPKEVSAYIAVVGKSTYNGHGKSTALAMLTINGNPDATNLDSEADGVYTVNPDCTGTETLTDRKTPHKQHPYAFIVDPEGKELRILALPTTDKEDGAVVRASVSKRVGED